jgi:hypothetical protein
MARLSYILYVKFLPAGQKIYIHVGMIFALARTVPMFFEMRLHIGYSAV